MTMFDVAYALEGLFESIQYELEPFGIKIIVVEPGGVDTNFLKNLKFALTTLDPLKSPYRSIQSGMSEYFKQWSQNLTHPSEVAKVVLSG
jgi:NAD(P)-dependent dehydrogenase (short-subunit alcohol dehydrogenase family)